MSACRFYAPFLIQTFADGSQPGVLFHTHLQITAMQNFERSLMEKDAQVDQGVHHLAPVVISYEHVARRGDLLNNPRREP